MRLLTYCNLVLWQWLLPVLLVLTAVVCAVRTHGIPVRGFCRTQREIITRLLRRDETKQRRIFASALAATMGTGNLTGTALALMTGRDCAWSAVPSHFVGRNCDRRSAWLLEIRRAQ